MNKTKLTISVEAPQLEMLRRSAPSTRTVGQRVGKVAEAMRNDWIHALYVLEYTCGWSRVQIEYAARTGSSLGVFDANRWNVALLTSIEDAADPAKYRKQLACLSPDYYMYFWIIGRELRLGNPEVEQRLRSKQQKETTHDARKKIVG